VFVARPGEMGPHRLGDLAPARDFEMGPHRLDNFAPARDYTCAAADFAELAAMLGA